MKPEDMRESTVFMSVMEAVVSIFGITWTGDIFFHGCLDQLKGLIKLS
ncbi:anaerobic C4-dicarboxylate transporter family protein [Pajaroellobacter abortibovis]